MPHSQSDRSEVWSPHRKESLRNRSPGVARLTLINDGITKASSGEATPLGFCDSDLTSPHLVHKIQSYCSKASSEPLSIGYYGMDKISEWMTCHLQLPAGNLAVNSRPEGVLLEYTIYYDDHSM